MSDESPLKGFWTAYTITRLSAKVDAVRQKAVAAVLQLCCAAVFVSVLAMSNHRINTIKMCVGLPYVWHKALAINARARATSTRVCVQIIVIPIAYIKKKIYNFVAVNKNILWIFII